MPSHAGILLEAIEGASGDDTRRAPHPRELPRRPRAACRAGDVAGRGVEDRTPASRCTSARCPPPSSRPTRVYLAIARSFNTVDLDLRAVAHLPLPRPAGARVGVGRPPRRTSASSAPASGVVLGVGSAVRNWKPGDRVVVHCNYVDDQDPLQPRRLDAGRQPAHLELRVPASAAWPTCRSSRPTRSCPSPPT